MIAIVYNLKVRKVTSDRSGLGYTNMAVRNDRISKKMLYSAV